MEVKTNKEYTAMLHEIEGVEREIRAREDQVLAEMERAETPDRPRSSARRRSSRRPRSEHRRRAAAQLEDEEARRCRSRRGRLARSATPWPPAAADAAGAASSAWRGCAASAVAEARDGMCQVCHVKLRPQMYVDLKRNEEIVQCPACNRILYYEPPAPVVVPEP